MDIGDKVKIRLPGGVTLKGTITTRVYTYNSSPPTYGGFQFGVAIGGDANNVKYYFEQDLVLDGTQGYLDRTKCTCGSQAVNSVNHSDYCDKVLKV